MLNADEVQAVIYEGLPAASEEGLRIEEVGARRARVRSPFRPSTLRPGGSISGPTMMGLADAAMYAAILGELGRVEMAVTQNLNINFLSRPAPADLIAEAVILRLGRRAAVLEVQLFSEGNDEMVAHVTGTYALPSS
ncbi:PaaI family thioesterase [Alcanivorax sp.]|uniref:PaaI family thioesterase n=1 Tax=Alcanivorax sp. TaxID=1872427 RepID=UPI000C637CD6|nr:PaaI family thioesterase [Alcanivorax sp.]MBQ24649.1 thioesterase [Alcanivorax sp.]